MLEDFGTALRAADAACSIPPSDHAHQMEDDCLANLAGSPNCTKVTCVQKLARPFSDTNVD